MYSKLLIKAAILLLVINVAFVGVITVRMGRLVVAIFNLIAIFVLLFQERSAFQTANPTNKRILFTTDVFGWIAVGVGLIVAGLSQVRGTTLPPILRGIFAGGLYYLGTVAVFGLAEEEGYRKDSGVRVVGVIVGVILIGILLRAFNIISSHSIRNSYSGMVGRWQRSLQSIVVDETVQVPDDGSEVVIDLDEDSDNNNEDDENDSDTETGALSETGTIAEPNDNLEPTSGRVFTPSTTSQPGSLTFANFLPVLFATLQIPASTNDYTFTNVNSSSPLYPSFVLARDYTMVGTAINPASSITCQTLMVLLGLAQERDIDYTSATVLDVFRAEGVERGYTAYGCTDRDAVAQWANLP